MTINRGQLDEERLLLAAARLGDERAFGQLVDHHRLGLELYCCLMLGCPDRAHEAVLETLLRGWHEIDCADPSTSARIWLYRLATGICLAQQDATD